VRQKVLGGSKARKWWSGNRSGSKLDESGSSRRGRESTWEADQS